MTGGEKKGKWISLYIYGDPQSRWLLELFLRWRYFPETSGLSNPFFVRYADARGPHIRVRARLQSPSIGLRQAHSRLESVIRERSHETGSRPRRLCIRVVRYRAEVGRYGGSHALGAAEALFSASSFFVVQALSSFAHPLTGLATVIVMNRLFVEALAANRINTAALFAFATQARVSVAQKLGVRMRVEDFIAHGEKNIGDFNRLIELFSEKLARLRPGAHGWQKACERYTKEVGAIGWCGPVLGRDTGKAKAARAFVAWESIMHMNANRCGLNIIDECGALALASLIYGKI